MGLGWAVLGWLGWGEAGRVGFGSGFAFLFCFGGLGLGLLGLGLFGSVTCELCTVDGCRRLCTAGGWGATFHENSKLMKTQQSEIHEISSYPALEGVGFRVHGSGFRV